jgi:hypothetical protein
MKISKIKIQLFYTFFEIFCVCFLEKTHNLKEFIELKKIDSICFFEQKKRAFQKA